MTRFEGFLKDMFSVYVPEKWSSMVHNLPRMRNKDTLLALCSMAEQGLQEELLGLSRATSDEIPNIVNQKKVDAQWVYWYRDEAARAGLASFLEKTPLDGAAIFNIAPQDKHVTLAVVMRLQALWVGLRVAAGAVVDRRNLATKLEHSWERENFLAMLHELPEGALVGFEGQLLPIHDVTLETLTRTAAELNTCEAPWRVGCEISDEEAVTLGVDAVDHVHRWLGILADIYRFVAWTRDNDLIEASKKIQEDKAQKRRQATAFAKGDRVRFISGLFSGKIGVVQETDTRAQVKVRVGKMSVVVAGTDLTPA